jgi:hypothetical protein
VWSGEGLEGGGEGGGTTVGGEGVGRVGRRSEPSCEVRRVEQGRTRSYHSSGRMKPAEAGEEELVGRVEGVQVVCDDEVEGSHEGRVGDELAEEWRGSRYGDEGRVRCDCV